MEVSAGVAASASTRGSSLSMPPPPPPSSSSSSSAARKEWRAVSEHRNAGDEELERSKLGQLDERTIYEVQQGREPLDVGYCSITVDGGLNDELLPQRLHNLARQREELQRMEIEIKAQLISRSEIVELQTTFDARIKDHANATAKLQEQLREREQAVHELERKMEEKDRELHAIKLDNEVAWAKEDLLREQNKELASFRRERNHSEVERALHIKQIHDLQEHIQEKERQLIELQDQDGSGEPAHTFENMWDLTPDTDLLMELPEEYNFETSLADLIDNSLQAVWSNSKNDRRLIRLEDNNLSHISVSTLYLSLCRGKYDSSVIFKSIDKAKFLRTFLPLDHESCRLSSNELQNMLCKLQFLSVLSLSHYHITELPASVRNLKHLRYIDLSHTGIKWLPESVCALCNLQTFILTNCHSLTKLPKNMWRLVNLRHLDISGTDLNEMPKNLSRLKKLQTLHYFVVGKRSGSMLKELGGPRDLHGMLHISKLQNVVSENDPAGAHLFTKKYLDELVLEWSNNTVDQENVLEALQPNSKLKKLSINFYCGTRFPNWVGHMSFFGMVSLRLSNCNNCSSLPPLGQLPSLEVLIIEWMDAVKSVGPKFCGMDKPFKSLKTLTFEGMSEWEEWVSFEVGGE